MHIPSRVGPYPASNHLFVIVQSDAAGNMQVYRYNSFEEIKNHKEQCKENYVVIHVAYEINKMCAIKIESKDV